MEIPQPLPQFERENALIIVLGRKNGTFYFARKGTLARVGGFDVEPEPYSDREGFFLRAGHSLIFGSGSSLRDIREYLKAKFLKNLANKSNSLSAQKKVNAVYIFSPKGIIPSVLGAVAGGRIKERMIKAVISGNMGKKHPTELVRMIENFQNNREEESGADIDREEERKILTKSNKARQVIKGKSSDNPFR
ncbi:MAG: hypothetical protein WC858_02330 [Parcubacteria group bacterium]|jgi:hypothetical protein